MDHQLTDQLYLHSKLSLYTAGLAFTYFTNTKHTPREIYNVPVRRYSLYLSHLCFYKIEKQKIISLNFQKQKEAMERVKEK